MAQGITSSFTEDVSFTSKFEMTKNDDILNIIGATVTLKNPACDLHNGQFPSHCFEYHTPFETAVAAFVS